jgi:23S rRNA pseudouridine2457 synthase
MHHHYILHKPAGYISQFVSNEPTRRNKKKLGELYDFAEGTMAIGRLDQNSEGLLLLTTDGKVSEAVRSKTVEKEYYILVDGMITDEAISRLTTGVTISIHGKRYTTLPCHAHRLKGDPGFAPRATMMRGDNHGPMSWVSVTITEGKYRQVRKMSAAVGYPVIRLVRVRIGHVLLKDMAQGAVIEVDKFDI